MFFNVYRRNVFQCSQQGAASPAGSSFSRLAGAPPGSEMEKVFIFTSGIFEMNFKGTSNSIFLKHIDDFFRPQKFQLTWFWKKECSCYFSGIQVPAFFQLWLLLAPTFSPFLLFSSISFSSHFHTGNNTTSVLQVSLGSCQVFPRHHGVRNKSQRTKSQIKI